MENTPQTPVRRERRACRTAEPGDPGGDACPCPVLCVQEPGDRAGATLEHPEKGEKDPTVFQQDPFVENRAQGTVQEGPTRGRCGNPEGGGDKEAGAGSGGGRTQAGDWLEAQV